MPFLGVYKDPTVTREIIEDPLNLPLHSYNDLPVCWVGTSLYGTMSMVGTEKEYQRKGLASLILTAIGRIQLQLGLFPSAHVDFRNPASRGMGDGMEEFENTHIETFFNIGPNDR